MWWQWIIFIVFIFWIPISLAYLTILIKKRNSLTREQEKTMNLNIVKYMLFYWLCDLFYMSFIINNISLKFIFGGLIMIIVFYNVSNSFLSNRKKEGIEKFGLLQDFIVGIAISIYLIFIIPNVTLREIILTMSAAIFGGLFTLVGVAWTIRKGDADRNAELLRIEKERKEEERKIHVPYLKVVNKPEFFDSVGCYVHETVNFSSPESLTILENDTFYTVLIEDFFVKNISTNNLLLNGIMVDNKYYKFENQHLLESDAVCEINLRARDLIFAKPLNQLLLCVEDIIGHKYTISCVLNPDLFSGIPKTTEDGKEYSNHCYKYEIKNITLPILFEVQE